MNPLETASEFTEEQANALLLRAADGDAAAMNELFAHERDLLRRWATIPPNAKIGISISADIQETMMKASVHLPTLRVKTITVFRAWLLTVLRNKIRERHRKRRPDDLRNGTVHALADQIVDASPSAPEQIEKDELDAMLLRHIDSLSTDQRFVIVMYHFEGLSVNRIAEVLDKTEDAVHGLLNRGRKKLRDLLGDAHDS